MPSLPLPSLSASPALTLMDALLPATESQGARLLRKAALALCGSLLLIASAKMAVPFWPVPMTMQSFAVIAIAAAIGPSAGVASVALYLAYGMMGYPVFASTPPAIPGPAYLLGPTGGVLLSFLPAAAIAGWAAVRGASLTRLIAGLTLTHVVILGLGGLWLGLLAQMANGATGIGLELAFAKGVTPFLLGSVVKVALTAALTLAGWRFLARRG